MSDRRWPHAPGHREDVGPVRCKFCGLAGDRVALLKRECPDLLRVALDAALDRERDVRADLRDLRKRITRLEALRREANATPKPPC